MQADSSGGVLTDPLSLNRYAYAGDNPMTFVDPTGRSWWNSWTSYFLVEQSATGSVRTIASQNSFRVFTKSQSAEEDARSGEPVSLQEIGAILATADFAALALFTVVLAGAAFGDTLITGGASAPAGYLLLAVGVTLIGATQGMIIYDYDKGPNATIGGALQHAPVGVRDEAAEIAEVFKYLSELF